MNNFLKALDRKAGNWLDTIDDQLHQPLMQTLSGDVFTDGIIAEDHEHSPAPAPRQAHTAHPNRDVVMLRKVNV